MLEKETDNRQTQNREENAQEKSRDILNGNALFAGGNVNWDKK